MTSGPATAAGTIPAPRVAKDPGLDGISVAPAQAGL
jgi:hypothetical protein